MKAPMTIEERVDKLLEHGVNNPKKWMSIHGYIESAEIAVDDWKEEYKVLRDHHLEETKVLFEIIAELAKRINK